MNRFPNQYEKFVDTRGCGGITLDGVELKCDNGIIEAPVRYEDALLAHGFMRLNGKEHVKYLKSRPAPAAKPEPVKVEQAAKPEKTGKKGAVSQLASGGATE